MSAKSEVLHRSLIVGLLLFTGLPMACVTTGKYDALQNTLDATQAKLNKSQLNLQDEADKVKKLRASEQTLQQRIVDLEALRDRLQAEKSQLETDKNALEAKQAELESKLASVVKDKSRLKGSIDDMKQALSELNQRKLKAEQRISEYKQLLQRFQSLIDAGKLKVKIVDGRMVVALATDVLFASGSARLSKEGKDAIAEVSQVLAQIPRRAFQVEGHTDNVPIRTTKYPSNWELAAARSLTVVKEMVAAGMPAERISAASFGEFKPAASNDSEEGRAANRRIEIVVVPDLSSLPGFDELQKAAQEK